MTEHEPHTEQEPQGKGITRRQAAAGIASWTVLFTLRNGVTLNPLNQFYSPELVLSSNPEIHKGQLTTIAHNAGDSIEGMERAHEAGAQYADANLNKSGRHIFVYHGENISIGDAVLAGFDMRTLNFRLGPPKLRVEELFEKAKDLGIGLHLELKRGRFGEKDVKFLLGFSEKNDVPTYLFSHNFAIMDMGRKTTGKNGNFVYAPKDYKEWRRFFEEQSGEPRKVVLTNHWSAWRYQRWLAQYNTTVFVMNAETDAKVRELNRYGVVNGYFEDLGVLQQTLVPSVG